MRRIGVTMAAAAFALAAVTSTAAAVTAEGRASTVWRTDGYGSIIAVDGDRLRTYETTAISCLPGLTARRTGARTFTTADGEVMRMAPGRLRIDGSPGYRALRRISALPAACTRPAAKDPVTTFDVFWQTFAENYPFFAAKGVDWRRVRDRYRPRVTPATTGPQLARIFDDMIAPLNDAHTYVLTGDAPPVPHLRPGTTPPSPDYDRRIRSYVERRDAHGALRGFAQDRIGYADLPGHLGYLRISGFTGYTHADTYAANAAELDEVLDAIFTSERARTLCGLIIDVRVNGGGDDALGLRVAARLTDRPYMAYAKRARNDPDAPAVFTVPQPIVVRPAPAPIYRGPIALLTAGSTFSAGETFIQSLIDRAPAPTRIGRPTQGVFSDVLDRSLPNGWAFGLPNEEFLTRTGRTFDGVGIPPHVETPVFTPEELARDRDSAFDHAVTLLTSRNGGNT